MSLPIFNKTAVGDIGLKLFILENESDSKYTWLVPVTAAPATGSAPATIEVTELDMEDKAYIADRVDRPQMEFDFNHTVTKFARVQSFADGTTRKFLLVYGDNSGYKIEASLNCWHDAVSLGSAIKGKLTLTVSRMEYIQDVSELIPQLTALTFSCAKGSANGTTKVASVSPSLTSGNSYLYKVGTSSMDLPDYASRASGTPYTLGNDIIVSEGQYVAIIEVDAYGRAMKGGKSEAVVENDSSF